MTFDKSVSILETPFTIAWLEATLQASLETDAKLVTCHARRVGEGFGYVGLIVHVQLSWDRDVTSAETPLPNNVVLKIPTVATVKNLESKSEKSGGIPSEPEMAVVADLAQKLGPLMPDIIKTCHNCECEAYRLLSLSPCRRDIFMPKSYHEQPISDEEGKPAVIVMDYLGDIGAVRTAVQPLQLPSLLQVADALASLHASCLQKRLIWQENIDKLKGGYANCFKLTDEQFRENTQLIVDMLKKSYPEKFDPLADRLLDFGYNNEGLKLIGRINSDLGMPPVLVHGDLWMSNMMFYKDDGGKPTDNLLAIIDWQAVHTGCVAEDFTRLLGFSTTSKIRREHTDTVLQHYYRSLKEKLNGIEPGFSYETLRKAFGRLFALDTAFVICWLPFYAKKPEMLGTEDPEAVAAELIDRAHAMLQDSVTMMDQ